MIADAQLYVSNKSVACILKNRLNPILKWCSFPISIRTSGASNSRFWQTTTAVPGFRYLNTIGFAFPSTSESSAQNREKLSQKTSRRTTFSFRLGRFDSVPALNCIRIRPTGSPSDKNQKCKPIAHPATHMAKCPVLQLFPNGKYYATASETNAVEATQIEHVESRNTNEGTPQPMRHLQLQELVLLRASQTPPIGTSRPPARQATRC